jgi:hypothetical protein
MGKKDPVKNKKQKVVKDGQIPGTFENQNLGHNSKKEGLGTNTNR